VAGTVGGMPANCCDDTFDDDPERPTKHVFVRYEQMQARTVVVRCHVDASWSADDIAAHIDSLEVDMALAEYVVDASAPRVISIWDA
jgi:hypothetical protein